MPQTLTPASQPGQAAGESPPVLALVEFTAKPRDQARVLDELNTVARRWAGEAGCSHVTAWRDPADETRFLVLEGFVSGDAFQAHLAMPATREFASRVRHYLAAPPTRTIWHPATPAASQAQDTQ
jgi:quinol monooxygenase YgiN